MSTRAPFHIRESERMAVLRRCGVLDTAPEPTFDGLTALAAAIVGTPIALVSLVDDQRQWFKSACGLGASQTPREHAFCAHAIINDGPAFVVEDARRDPRFSDNPLVTGQPKVIFYAGIPLRVGPDHLPLGTLCVIDHQPKCLTDVALHQLALVAKQVELLLEQRLRQRDLEDRLITKTIDDDRHALLTKVSRQVPGMVYQFLQAPDGSRRFPYSSAGIEQIYGVTPTEAEHSAQAVIDRLHPLDRDRVLESIQISAEHLTKWVCEYRYLHPDGQLRWLHDNSSPERLPDGSILWHGFITDIGERKEREATLQRQEARYRLLVENATYFAIIMLSPSGLIESWNPGAQRIKGYLADDIIGKHFSCFYRPQDHHIWETALTVAHTSGRFEHVGWRVRQDGTLFWANVVITPILTEDGTLCGFTKITRDISDRLQAERTEAFLTSLVHAANVSIVATDINGLITAFNPGAERMLGYRADDMIGQASPAIHHDPAEVVARAAELTQEFGETIEPGFGVFVLKPTRLGVPDEREWTYVCKDGRRIPVQLSVTTIRTHDGTITGYLGIASDISLQKQQREKLENAQLLLQADYSEAEAYRRALDQNAIVSMTDLTGRITYANSAFCTISGYHSDELIGRNHNLVSSGVHDRAFWKSMWDTVNSGNSWRGVVCNRHKCGTLYWVDSLISPFRALDGSIEKLVSIRFDVTQQKLLEVEVQTQRERLTLAITGGNIGIWDYLVEENQLLWDEQMYRLYGISMNRFGGAYDAWASAIHPDDRARSETELAAALSGQSDFNTMFRIRWPDGTIRVIRAHALVKRDENGKALRMIGTNWDITRETEQEEALRKAMDAAKAGARAKADFLAVMSHEIRTPMNGVIGMTNLLVKTTLNAQQRDYVETVRSCGESLLTLINDILDFSKLEAGRVTLEAIPFSLIRVIEDVVLLFSGQAEQKGVTLSYQLPSSLPQTLIGDPTRLRQILLNIVSNALKFTEQGSVTVTVSATNKTEQQVDLAISVRDTGIGMTPAQMARLGEAFSQADSSTTRKFGGSGLGMTISKALIELMKGELAVESELGNGSTFRVHLGFAIGVDSASNPSQITLNGRRILCLDDDPKSLHQMESICRSFGMQVDAFTTAQDLMSHLRQAPLVPDLILTDHEMAGINGLMLAMMVHAEERFTALPIVIASSDPERARAAIRSSGSCLLFEKPLIDVGLSTVFNAALHPRHHAAPSGIQKPPVIRLQRILVADDNRINQRVIVSMLKGYAPIIETVDDGAKALAAVQHQRYDCIFMDCQMPEMDGYQATQAIRSHELGLGLPRLPIFALTAHAMEGAREECLAAGMDDYLSKPIREADLNGIMQRWFAGQNDTPSAASAVNAATDPLVILRQTMDESDIRCIAQELVTQFPRLREELAQAITTMDRDRLRRLAHNCKGAASSLNLIAVEKGGKELESTAVNGSNELLRSLVASLSHAMGDSVDYFKAYLAS